MRHFLRRIKGAISSPAVIEFENSVQALYETDLAECARFRVHLRWCVDAIGYSFAPDAQGSNRHPYVGALLERAAQTGLAYAGSALRTHYAAFQPALARDLFPEARDSALGAMPANTHFVPWLTDDPDERVRKTRRALANEFPGVGMPNNPLFGPLSDQQGEVEYDRIYRVFTSIRECGYRPPKHRKDDIQGLALRRGDEMRFLVTAGKHRVAALSALAHLGEVDPEIPARFRRPLIIDIRDIREWPQVRRGGWRTDAAARYMERLFAGISAQTLLFRESNDG